MPMWTRCTTNCLTQRVGCLHPWPEPHMHCYVCPVQDKHVQHTMTMMAEIHLIGHLQAYLSVAPVVAGFPEYFPGLVEFLMTNQLRHWEASLRALAAKALGALVEKNSASFAGQLLQKLLDLTVVETLEVAFVHMIHSCPCIATFSDFSQFTSLSSERHSLCLRPASARVGTAWCHARAGRSCGGTGSMWPAVGSSTAGCFS